MEKDDEVKGSGNSYTYKYRVHDPRLGRFLSIDPISGSYPHNGPYNFCENRVIDGIELEGLEFTKYWNKEAYEKRLDELIDNPILINQRGAGTCVIAAVVYIWILKDPEQFRDAAMKLYENGSVKVNNYLIDPDKHLFDVDPDKADHSQVSKYKNGQIAADYSSTESTDWIILSSIQDAQNSLWDFEGLYLDADAGNNQDDKIELMTNLLGFKVVRGVFSDDIKHTQEYWNNKIQEMDNLNFTGYLMLSIDVNLLGDARGGGHAVTYAGNMTSAENANGELVYSFDIQTYGETRTITATAAEMNAYFKGYTYGSDLPEENEIEAE